MLSSRAMKRVVWIVGLYLLLDLVSAGLPGAFAFDPDQSTEVARCERSPRAHPPVPTDITPAVPLRSLDLVPNDALLLAVRACPAPSVPAWAAPPPRMAADPAEVDSSAAA